MTYRERQDVLYKSLVQLHKDARNGDYGFGEELLKVGVKYDGEIFYFAVPYSDRDELDYIFPFEEYCDNGWNWRMDWDEDTMLMDDGRPFEEITDEEFDNLCENVWENFCDDASEDWLMQDQGDEDEEDEDEE